MKIPSELIASLVDVCGFDESQFLKIHSEPAVTSFRINPAKPANLNFDLNEKVPWTTYGYYLNHRPSFTLDPLFHAGTYYVQEASSMFLEHALKQTVDLEKDLRVLDLCAAPGGKSTHIQSLISKHSLLVSNEIVKSRLSVLEENMTKWGAANVICTGNNPSDFKRLEHFFDVMVTDVPCSGSGLFRKDEAAILEWSESNVQHCSVRQRSILNDVLPALKPNGCLIYATCSYSPKEDEEICDYLLELGMDSIRVDTPEEWNIVATVSEKGATGYRFYPYNLKGEGFFLAVFQKQDERSHQRLKTEKLATIPAASLKSLEEFVNLDACEVVKFQNRYLLFGKGIASFLPFLQKNLYIRKAGVSAGEIAKSGLIPDHELAMSNLLNKETPTYDLTLEESLQYLRCQTFEVKKTGWLLMRYNHVNLGWAKGLQNRMNNYYPSNWRILNK